MGIDEVAGRAIGVAGGGPVYLSVDIDVLDPACSAPWTPEPGGLRPPPAARGGPPAGGRGARNRRHRRGRSRSARLRHEPASPPSPGSRRSRSSPSHRRGARVTSAPTGIGLGRYGDRGCRTQPRGAQPPAGRPPQGGPRRRPRVPRRAGVRAADPAAPNGRMQGAGHEMGQAARGRRPRWGSVTRRSSAASTTSPARSRRSRRSRSAISPCSSRPGCSGGSSAARSSTSARASTTRSTSPTWPASTSGVPR